MHDLTFAGHFKILGIVLVASIAFVVVGQNVRPGTGASPAEMPGYDRRVPREQPQHPATILIASIR